MNMLKRTLAMFLVLCMMIGAMPFAAFADETDGTIVTEPQETVEETTEAPSEGDNVDTTPTTEAPSEGDNVDTTPTTEAPSEGDDVDTTPTTEAPSEAVDVGPTVGEIIGELDTIPAAEDDAADVNCVPTTEAPSEDDDADNAPTEAPEEEIATAGISSITMGTKPVDGTTKDEPFPYGTAGSNSFRIPALVTLSDGTMVAAADARWNTTYDGGGLDTIVSYSTDGGATWHYTFANYLGDHGNEYNGSQSTAFIDPALTVVGDTVYMLVDLYPYGVALNGSGNTHPSTATGFNDDGKLLLSANNHQSYDFYLDGDTIYSKDGTPVEGYTVDAYFNITEDSTSLESNLFFSHSPAIRECLQLLATTELQSLV